MSLNSSSTDEELMRAYQEGESKAFEILFQRHSDKVYGFLINRLKDRSEAQDVFQATFLKLHQARHHYDPSFPFTPWLFTVCKSVLVDHVRKSQRSRLELDDEIVDKAAAPNSEPTDAAIEMDLSSLSDSQKEVIQLRYEDDLSFEEIAARLKTSPSNVRQLLSRGLRKIRSLAGVKGENS